jgi:hypothetical protein
MPKTAVGGEAEAARSLRASIAAAEAGLRQKVNSEIRASRAADAFEAKADKSLRPGSPEWRRKVNRAGVGR